MGRMVCDPYITTTIRKGLFHQPPTARIEPPPRRVVLMEV